MVEQILPNNNESATGFFSKKFYMSWSEKRLTEGVIN
jgi:hypothetical protein